VARSAHLVGSIPAGDAEGAMRLALDRLGHRLRFLPDGETGERRNWLISDVESFREHPDFEVKKEGDWSDYDKLLVFKLRRGHRPKAATLDFGKVAAFEQSWPTFQKLREEAGDPELAFQVGIPGDLDMPFFVLGPVWAFRHRRPFREATAREIREIFERAGRDVVFQVELPVEMVMVARMPGPLQAPMATFLARGIARLVREAPEGARFGVHLCLGDMNHRALGKMTDAAPLVRLANAIAKAWPPGRPLEFLHAPFAAADQVPSTDPAWYAPLSGLRLPPSTRFVAGVAHEDQDLGAQGELVALIERLVGREVDVATSCGLGRRTLPAAAAALDRTAELTAP
jgi:hypothetical protein